MGAFLVIWLVASIITGHLGNEKRIGYWETVIISLCLSPLIGAIAACASKDTIDIEREKQILKTLQDIRENQIKNQSL